MSKRLRAISWLSGPASDSDVDAVLALIDAPQEKNPTEDPETGIARLDEQLRMIEELENIADNEKGQRARNARDLLALPVFHPQARFLWLRSKEEGLSKHKFSQKHLAGRQMLLLRGYPMKPSDLKDPTGFVWFAPVDGVYAFPVNDAADVVSEIELVKDYGLEHGVFQSQWGDVRGGFQAKSTGDQPPWPDGQPGPTDPDEPPPDPN